MSVMNKLIDGQPNPGWRKPPDGPTMRVPQRLRMSQVGYAILPLLYNANHHSVTSRVVKSCTPGDFRLFRSMAEIPSRELELSVEGFALKHLGPLIVDIMDQIKREFCFNPLETMGLICRERDLTVIATSSASEVRATDDDLGWSVICLLDEHGDRLSIDVSIECGLVTISERVQVGQTE